jgi:putative PEP-CTERM system TPR-repeat lipoprotein
MSGKSLELIIVAARIRQACKASHILATRSAACPAFIGLYDVVLLSQSIKRRIVLFMKTTIQAVFFLFVSCLVLTAAGCGESLTADEHIANAETSLSREDYQPAIVELKNALRLAPDNARARQLLGEVSLAIGDVSSAEKEFKRALESGGPGGEIYPPYARVLVALNRHSQLAELPLTELTPEGRSTVRAAQALSLSIQGDDEAAQQMIAEELGESASPFALVAGARLALARDASGTRSKQLLDRALAIDADFVPALRLLAGIAASKGDSTRADEAYTKAIANTPQPFGDHYLRGLARVGSDKPDAAEEDLEAMRRIQPEHPGAYYLEGLIAMAREDFARAEDAFTEAAVAAEQYPKALYYLAALQRDAGNSVQALNYANRYLAGAKDDVRAIKLTAGLEYQFANHARVIELLEPLVEQFPDDDYSVDLLARSLMASGNADRGIEILEQVAQREPDSSAALTLLGAGLLAKGQAEEGVAKLKAAQALNPGDPQIEQALVGAYLREGNESAALAQAKAYANRYPDQADPHRIQGRIHLVSGEITQARVKFAEAQKLDPTDVESSLILAELAVRDRDLVAARGHYGDVLEQDPENLKGLMGLASLEALEGRESAMVETLERTMLASPSAIEPRLVLSRYYLSKRSFDEVVAVWDDLPNAGKEVPEVMEVLAEAEFSRQGYNAADAILRQLVALRPNSSQAHFLLARTQTSLGDINKAIASLETSVALNSRFLPAQIALARLYLQTGQNEKLKVAVQSLVASAPDNPDVMRLQAVVANREGEPEVALSRLEKVFNENPSTGSMLSLAIQRRATGDEPGAIELLSDWVGANPDDALARQNLGDFLAAAGNEGEAITVYREVLTKDPQNATVLNNLAWLLRERDPDAALDYVERAIAAADNPRAPTLLDTKAQIHLASGDLRLARRAIDGALDAAPTRPDLRYSSAQIHVAEGEAAAAVAELTRLLKEHPEFARRAEVEALLEEIR